jgi:hypothetical protein
MKRRKQGSFSIGTAVFVLEARSILISTSGESLSLCQRHMTARKYNSMPYRTSCNANSEGTYLEHWSVLYLCLTPRSKGVRGVPYTDLTLVVHCSKLYLCWIPRSRETDALRPVMRIAKVRTWSTEADCTWREAAVVHCSRLYL